MKNKYEVISLVGEGAYGIVYKARVKETGEYVAIKKFKETSDELIQKTMKRELKVLKLIHHENIVEFKEGFHRKGNLFLIFEFVDKNLLEVLQQSPTGLEPQLIRSLIFQLCKATCYLHEKTIIHRDIKPENLLIDKQNNLKLCDFGFARRISGREIMTDYVATRWYRAPELLINNGEYGPEVDFWAIGCIMGELADGNPLFPGENEVDQIHCIQKILGNLPKEQVDKFKTNPLFKGFKLLDVREPVGIERRYLGILGNKAIEFMKALLELDPRKRPNYRNVLDFEYFKCFREKKNYSGHSGKNSEKSLEKYEKNNSDNKYDNNKYENKYDNKHFDNNNNNNNKYDKFDNNNKHFDNNKYNGEYFEYKENSDKMSMKTSSKKLLEVKADVKIEKKKKDKKEKYTDYTVKSEKNPELTTEKICEKELRSYDNEENDKEQERNYENGADYSSIIYGKKSAKNKRNIKDNDEVLLNSKGKSYVNNFDKKQGNQTRNPIKNTSVNNSTLNKSNNKDRTRDNINCKNLNSSSDFIKNNNSMSPQNYFNIKINNNNNNNNTNANNNTNTNTNINISNNTNIIHTNNNNNNNNNVFSPMKKEDEIKASIHYKKITLNEKQSKKNHVKYFEKYSDGLNTGNNLDKNDFNDKIIEESSNYNEIYSSETLKENNINNTNTNKYNLNTNLNNSNNNNNINNSSNINNSNTKYKIKDCNLYPVTYKKVDQNEKQKNYATIAMTTNNLFCRKVKQKKSKEHKKKEFFSLEKNGDCLLINNINNNNYLSKNLIPLINNNKSVKNKKGFEGGYKTFYSSKKDDKYNYKININFKKTSNNLTNTTSNNNNTTSNNNNSNHNDKKYKKIIEEVEEISEFNNNETAENNMNLRNNQRSNFLNLNFNIPKKLNPNVSSLDFNKTSERVFMKQINARQLKGIKVNSLNRNKKGSSSSLNILSQKIKKNTSQCSIPVVATNNNNNNISSGKEQISAGFISFYNLQLPTLNHHHGSKKFSKY